MTTKMYCYAGIVVAGLCAAGFAGCKETAQPTAGRELTIIAIDYSGSTENIRTQLLAACHELALDLDSNRSDLVVYRFGHNVEEIYSGVPEDEDTFAQILGRAARGSDPVPRTQYPEMLREMARLAGSAPEKRIRIIIAGDAFNDYAGDSKFAKIYRQAAKELAANEKVEFVRYWGAATGAREELRSTFRGCDGKLQVRSLDQGIG